MPGRTAAIARGSARDASGASASGLASRMSARRSVYFPSSPRRLGRPLASKRRNAASRPATTSRPPGSRVLTAANVAASAVSASVLTICRSAVIALASRGLVLIARIALGLELQRELLAAGPHDAALGKHMHDVRHDVVEQTLVVGDHHHGALRRTQPVDALGHHLD